MIIVSEQRFYEEKFGKTNLLTSRKLRILTI